MTEVHIEGSIERWVFPKVYVFILLKHGSGHLRFPDCMLKSKELETWNAPFLLQILVSAWLCNTLRQFVLLNKSKISVDILEVSCQNTLIFLVAQTGL